MGSFMFGITRGKLTAQELKIRRAVAKKHEINWIYADIPGQGLQGWFSGPNYGAPFDRDLARAVAADLSERGIGEATP